MMGWLTDEVLFYGGILLAGGALLLGILTMVILWAAGVRLTSKLEAEYGKDPYENRRRRRKRA